MKFSSARTSFSPSFASSHVCSTGLSSYLLSLPSSKSANPLAMSRKPRAIFPLSTIVIYFSSRLLRYATLISNHVIAPVRARLAAYPRTFSSLYSSIGAAEAAVEVLDERCLRVSIEVPKGVTWEAGQYMHLCFPAKGLGWGQW